MQRVSKIITLLSLLLFCVAPVNAGGVGNDLVLDKQRKLLVSTAPIAFSWSTDSRNVVTSSNRNNNVDICVFDSITLSRIKCIASIKKYKDVYFHDITWYQNTVLVVHGFDEGASVGKYNIEGWSKKEFVRLTEKEIRWLNDLEVTSATWDMYDNQLIYSEPLLGPLKTLRNGANQILDKKGFNPSVNQNTVVYTYYKDAGDEIGGIGGIAKLDKKTTKISQVTKSNDNSPSISNNGVIYFVRKYDNNSSAIMTIEGTSKRKIYQIPSGYRVDKAKISPDGSRIAYITWDPDSMKYSLLIRSVR